MKQTILVSMGIGRITSAENFTDIENHWAKNDIMFVTSHGLFSGTRNTNFSPDMPMTCGMFVTVLGNLICIDLEQYRVGNFIDVFEDAYYAPYVNWAAQMGIICGYNTAEFGPNDAITREQMAVIIKNYIEKMGYHLPQTSKAVTFVDSKKIAY